MPLMAPMLENRFVLGICKIGKGSIFLMRM